MFQNESEIRSAYLRYMDPDGLISNNPDPGRGSSGNLLLYTSHYIWTLYRNGILTMVDLERFFRAIQKCTLSPGVFARCPDRMAHDDNQQGPDDMIGLLSISAIHASMPFAEEFLEHGRTNWYPIREALRLDGRTTLAALIGWIRLPWCFNTVIDGGLTKFTNQPDGSKPISSNWAAWFGRFFSVISHAQFAAREQFPRWRLALAVGLIPIAYTSVRHIGWWNLIAAPIAIVGILMVFLGLRRIVWAVSVFNAGRGSDLTACDPWILSWYLVTTFRESGQKSFMCEMASRNFMRRLYDQWPNGLNSVYLKYWGSDNPTTRYFIT